VTVDPMNGPAGYRQCKATSKQSGERCKRRVSPGATVCAIHGGKAPQVIAKAQERLVEAESRVLLERLGAPDSLGNPVDELLAIGAEARSWLTVLRERVSELNSLTSTDKLAVERERAVVTLYERALDRTGRLLAELVKLNLDARRVAIDEMQTEMIFRALTAALATLPKQYQEPARLALVAALREEDRKS
jgi:hypothetical protein